MEISLNEKSLKREGLLLEVEVYRVPEEPNLSKIGVEHNLNPANADLFLYGVGGVVHKIGDCLHSQRSPGWYPYPVMAPTIVFRQKKSNAGALSNVRRQAVNCLQSPAEGWENRLLVSL